MIQTQKYTWLLGLAALLYAFVVPNSARAVTLGSERGQDVTVVPTTTFDDGLFHYDYTISNNTTNDFLLVTLDVAAQPNAIQNLATPDGFVAIFDAGLGLLDFGGEDSPGFSAGSTFTGFEFDSPFQPEVSSFTALRLDTNENPVTFTGRTSAPTAVPEPSTIAGLAIASTMLLFRRKRAGKPVAARVHQHHS